MTATLSASPTLMVKPSPVADGQIRHTIRQLLAELYPSSPPIERRRDVRYPFPHLIRLTPLGTDGEPLELTPPLVVVGKHISERGLAFFHQEPLPYRRAIVSFETRQRSWLSFLIDLHWCRFNRLGWYEGGGRLLQQVNAATAA